MGLLVDGVWKDQWYDTEKSGGRFERSASQFRDWVTRDGKPAAHFEKTVAITEDGPVLVSVEPDHERPVD